MEFTLLGAALVAVAGISLVLRYEAGRTNAADCTRDLWDALVTAAVAGVAAGRIASMVGSGVNPITHPGDLLIVRGGVDPVVATGAALLTFGWMVRDDLAALTDAAAPAAMAGLAGWHGGCLVRDSCLGTRSDLPWAWAREAGAVTRHPVELYAAVLLVVAAVLLIVWKRTARPPSGVVAAVGFAAAAAVRLVTEPLRLGLGSDPAPWYAAGMVLGLAVAGWRWWGRESRARG